MGGDYFVIETPNSFTYVGTGSSVLCTDAIFTCSIYNGNNQAIKVAASGSYNTIGLVKDFSVTLGSSIYASPTTFSFSTDYFYLSSYTSTNQLIDITDPINIVASRATFYRTCAGKCATCLTTNTSFCTSCYMVDTGVVANVTYGGFNTMTADNQCVDVCGPGYYNASNTCFVCTSPCQNCLGSLQCTSCLTGFYFIASNPATDRCKNVCPTGTFANSGTNTCDTCSPTCATCSGTPNTCTGCTGTLYLSGSQCISVCPDGKYENTVTNLCAPCDAGCLLTCDINATNCVGGCKLGYSKINATSNECVNQCPSGRVNNTLTGVCECSSSCLTCSGTLSNCTSCSSLILYQHACISQCPAMTYQPVGQMTCLNCIDPFCSICNATSCLTCQSNKYLYAGGCTSVCPDGTRL